MPTIIGSDWLFPTPPARSAGQREQNDRALKKACEEFAALFWEQVLRSMRRTVPEGGLLDGGTGEKLFRDLLDAEYARKVAQAEGSLAELLYRQLKPLTKT
ncbi:MAG: hypothetical protein PWQ41_506 [Bacillota bacterium]|nr:hypothetical protein [Bacillota bacterium]MDK2924732.1 hypothetical protein [Bacillota bacterium]MDK2960604.1 hypothetical protein [Bacillota bacterium]